MTLIHHPAANPKCDQCFGLGLAVARRGVNLIASPCACRQSICPKCQDSGFVMVASGRASRCTCRHVEARRRTFNAAKLPGRYTHATLDTCRDDAASIMIKEWLTNAPKQANGMGILFHGNVGCGKTHLVTAAARHLILHQGIQVRFVEFTHLVTDLKMTFERGEGATSLLDPLGKVAVLIIDELGKGRLTDFEHQLVDELVSRRYNAALPILATTNFVPGDPTGQPFANHASRQTSTPTLADRLHERVYSRLREMCAFQPIPIDDDRRRQIATARAKSWAR